MTWKEWRGFLKKRGKRVINAGSHGVFVLSSDEAIYCDNAVNALYAEEKQVKKIILNLIENDKWPNRLTVGQKYFCGCRFNYAIEFVEMLLRTTSPSKKLVSLSPSAELSDKEILHWLLMRIWDHQGQHSWRLSLDNLRRNRFDEIRRHEEYCLWFNLHFKIIGTVLKKLGEREEDGEIITGWECWVHLENKSVYSFIVSTVGEPTVPMLQDYFRENFRNIPKVK